MTNLESFATPNSQVVETEASVRNLRAAESMLRVVTSEDVVQDQPIDVSQNQKDWRYRGACKDEDPELFFPIGTKRTVALQIERAKAVCRRCPVVANCLEWSLDSNQVFGVSGGLSEEERAAIQRQRLRAR